MTQSAFTISASQLAAKLGEPRLRVVDAAWYLPAQNRDAKAEFAAERIPGAVYFDIDAISDRASPLPHMLPAADHFGREAGALGLSETDDIVVYDGPGMFSSPRAWWTLRVMGAENVRVLDGGFDRWKAAGLPRETGSPKRPEAAVFNARLNGGKVRDIADIRANISSRAAEVLDARSQARFAGKAPEPRPGLRSGHIPGSTSLPFDMLVRDGALRPVEELQAVFASLGVSPQKPVITSCGSGVTAAIISLALESIGHGDHALYDGSWAEWGQAEDAPIAVWE